MDITESMKVLGQFVPIMILFATFGATYAIGQVFQDKVTHEAPWWLPAFLFGFGTVLGSVYYFTQLDPAAVQEKPWFILGGMALLTGLGYAGFESLTWKFIAKKLYGTEDKPQ